MLFEKQWGCSMLKKSLLGAAIMAGLLSLPAMAQVQIGVAGPLTGSNAAAGDQMKTGATQAVADLNKAGGILGKQIQLTVSDDACDPKQAVSVANQMVEKKVVLVAGHLLSRRWVPPGMGEHTALLPATPTAGRLPLPCRKKIIEASDANHSL